MNEEVRGQVRGEVRGSRRRDLLRVVDGLEGECDQRDEQVDEEEERGQLEEAEEERARDRVRGAAEAVERPRRVKKRLKEEEDGMPEREAHRLGVGGHLARPRKVNAQVG